MSGGINLPELSEKNKQICSVLLRTEAFVLRKMANKSNMIVVKEYIEQEPKNTKQKSFAKMFLHRLRLVQRTYDASQASPPQSIYKYVTHSHCFARLFFSLKHATVRTFFTLHYC